MSRIKRSRDYPVADRTVVRGEIDTEGRHVRFVLTLHGDDGRVVDHQFLTNGEMTAAAAAFLACARSTRDRAQQLLNLPTPSVVPSPANTQQGPTL